MPSESLLQGPPLCGVARVPHQQVLHVLDLVVDVVEDLPAALCTLQDLVLLLLVLYGERHRRGEGVR